LLYYPTVLLLQEGRPATTRGSVHRIYIFYNAKSKIKEFLCRRLQPHLDYSYRNNKLILDPRRLAALFSSPKRANKEESDALCLIYSYSKFKKKQNWAYSETKKYSQDKYAHHFERKLEASTKNRTLQTILHSCLLSARLSQKHQIGLALNLGQISS